MTKGGKKARIPETAVPQQPQFYLCSGELGQALINHFAGTPHVYAEVAGLIQGLQQMQPAAIQEEEEEHVEE